MAKGNKVTETVTIEKLTLELTPLEVQYLSDLVYLTEVEYNNYVDNRVSGDRFYEVRTAVHDALRDLGAKQGEGRLIVGSPQGGSRSGIYVRLDSRFGLEGGEGA